MSRQEIFNALNEDYPVKADISNNPIGLFETQQNTPPTVDTVLPTVDTVLPTVGTALPTVDTLPPTTQSTNGE